MRNAIDSPGHICTLASQKGKKAADKASALLTGVVLIGGYIRVVGVFGLGEGLLTSIITAQYIILADVRFQQLFSNPDY